MKFEINKLQTVSGADLRDFLNSVGCTYPATYEVDTDCIYVCTLWLDTDAYENKKVGSETLRKAAGNHGRKKTTTFQKGDHFYCLLYSISGDKEEKLKARPADITPAERKLMDSEASKILDLLSPTKPTETKDIIKSSGLSYARVLKAMQQFEAMGKVEQVKTEKKTFSGGKAQRRWILKS